MEIETVSLEIIYELLGQEEHSTYHQQNSGDSLEFEKGCPICQSYTMIMILILLKILCWSTLGLAFHLPTGWVRPGSVRVATNRSTIFPIVDRMLADCGERANAFRNTADSEGKQR
jgi:hypothetical protein